MPRRKVLPFPAPCPSLISAGWPCSLREGHKAMHQSKDRPLVVTLGGEVILGNVAWADEYLGVRDTMPMQLTSILGGMGDDDSQPLGLRE